MKVASTCAVLATILSNRVESRLLQDEANITCEEGTILCRSACLMAADFNVSTELCEADDLELQCINPRGQISTGTDEGDFYPGCISSDASPVTEFPTLPDYPRDDSLCADFDVRFDDGVYDHTIELNDGNGALFQFTIVGDTVQGRLAYNGIFGYLGFGFVGPDPVNLMLGGKIILAMRGGNYTASDGLDLSLGYKVDEFIISEENRAFRHWQKPYADAADADVTGTVTSRDAPRRLDKASFQINTTDDGCYTFLRFEIHDIGGQFFQWDSTDTFMWVANDVDSYMQHHMENKGVFNINWKEYVSTVISIPGSGFIPTPSPSVATKTSAPNIPPFETMETGSPSSGPTAVADISQSPAPNMPGSETDSPSSSPTRAAVVNKTSAPNIPGSGSIETASPSSPAAEVEIIETLDAIVDTPIEVPWRLNSTAETPTITDAPLNGILTISNDVNRTILVMYAPNLGFNGVDEFALLICKNDNAAATRPSCRVARYIVTVRPINFAKSNETESEAANEATNETTSKTRLYWFALLALLPVGAGWLVWRHKIHAQTSNVTSASRMVPTSVVPIPDTVAYTLEPVHEPNATHVVTLEIKQEPVSSPTPAQLVDAVPDYKDQCRSDPLGTRLVELPNDGNVQSTMTALTLSSGWKRDGSKAMAAFCADDESV